MRRIILLVTVAAITAAMMAASAMPAMAAVFPEKPQGKPIAAGNVSNDPPGKGPDGIGNVGAGAFLQNQPECTGAEVFVHGHANDFDGRAGHCEV